MVWDIDARLTADALSPTLTMRFPITNFLRTQQHSPPALKPEPQNLKDSLRRYLGVAPKKDSANSRPNPILCPAPSAAVHAGALSTSASASAADSKLTPAQTASSTAASSSSSKAQDAARESLERSQHIRRVWLGPMDAHISSSRRQNSASAPGTPTMDESEGPKQPPKLLRASDFAAACSGILKLPNSALAQPSPSAASSLLSQQFDLTTIPAIATPMPPISSPDVLSPAVRRQTQALPLFPSAAASHSGEFKAFHRAKEYLLSRQIVPETNRKFGSQDVFKALVARSLPGEGVALSNAPARALTASALADAAAVSLAEEQVQRNRSTDSGSVSAVAGDESFITWAHISHAWGAVPKRGDETKLKPKAQSQAP